MQDKLTFPLSLKEEFWIPESNSTVSPLGKILKHEGDSVECKVHSIFTRYQLCYVFLFLFVQTPTVQTVPTFGEQELWERHHSFKSGPEASIEMTERKRSRGAKLQSKDTN